MADDKKHKITAENANEWLGSLGFLFPRNKAELSRFEKLYADYEFELSGDIINPEDIILGKTHSEPATDKQEDPDTTQNWKMAARNFSNIPDDILKRMKKNQDRDGNSNSEKE